MTTTIEGPVAAANKRIERHREAQFFLSDLCNIVYRLESDDTNEHLEEALIRINEIEGLLNISQDLVEEDMKTGVEWDYPGNETPHGE